MNLDLDQFQKGYNAEKKVDRTENAKIDQWYECIFIVFVHLP